MLNNHNLDVLLVFGLPLILFAVVYFLWQGRVKKKATRKLNQAIQDKLVEPASLHPSIDPSVCLGCGTCVSACPEGEILGLIDRKAVLVSPTSCIGHGACHDACPTDAITLVFGTESRGVEIPFLNADFETTVPGIYIAGELGGMGLIKNAIAQGKQAIDAISKTSKNRPAAELDLVIVGAGPAGLSAALAAKQKKLNFIVLEQDSIGGTISHYPRGKIVMTQPAQLPIVGKFQFREASKETLVNFWNDAVSHIEKAIKTGQQVTNIEEHDNGFSVSTTDNSYQCASVLLAMGRRGTPRKLDVPGEEMDKVVYRLIDPEQYKGQHILVVGGGDSAIEAALALAQQKGTTTTLSYRSPAFSRAKSKNRERLQEAEKNGNIQVLLESNVKEIRKDSVAINSKDETLELPNNAVLVCAGGILPTPFLKRIGINVEEKFGVA